MATTEEVKPHSETVTPAGIEIRYFTPPKRRYEVRLSAGPSDIPDLEFPEESWREVPSVTTVLDVLNKPGLTWWGQKVAVEGILELHDRTILKEHFIATSTMGKYVLTVTSPGEWQPVVATVENIVQALTEQKLTVNHQRDKAGDRGTAVHDAFELWAREGVKPDPEMFPPEERGYVVGLNAFLADVNPEPLAAEVMVGSVEHGFAGRYDIRFQTSKECQVVFKTTPKKGAQRATLKPGVFLGDLKTSKGIYPTHAAQLIAYEIASVECGYEPTDARGVIHVSADGTYEFRRAKAPPEAFLAVLEAWKFLNESKEWI